MGIMERLRGKPRESELVRFDAVQLDSDPTELVAAVGESHYQEALRHACGSDHWQDVRFDCLAALVPEPGNRYDPDAVMVQLDGQLTGYLSRGDAIDYGPVVRPLFEEGRVILCPARIAGRGPGSDTSNLGIFLKLPPVADALEELAGTPGSDP